MRKKFTESIFAGIYYPIPCCRRYYLNSKSTIPGAKDHSAVNNSKDIKEKAFQ